MKSILLWRMTAIGLAFILPLAMSGAAFAAGAKKKGRKNQASSKKGFGAPPPSLDQVLETFRTRLPQDVANLKCPCGSDEDYESACCGVFHSGRASPESPLDVLKSRYSAFSLRNIKYVMDTTHPTCRDYMEDRIAWAKDLNKGGMFDSYDFVKLETIGEEVIQDDEEAFLEFKVTLRAKEDTSSVLAGQEMTVREKSRFLRDEQSGGRWLYASGAVTPEVEGLEDTVINQ